MNKIDNINPQKLLLENFNVEDGIKFSLLPSILDDKEVFFTTENKIIDALNYYNSLDFKLPIILTDEDSFNRLLNQFMEVKTESELSSDIEVDEEFNFDELKMNLDILDSENSAPIIKFVNSMFFQAIKKRASDIHIETHELFGVIRFRIDGVLFTQAKFKKQLASLVINRIKVISNLDISEKRKPQDGRCQINVAKKTVDIRVSVLPTYFGEKIVLRILMESEDIPTLKDLGFTPEISTGFKELLEHSYGMILVTGPTGSGKSTTLHSFLQTIASPEKNIITIEDPVEYKADNINQIQVNQKVGLTFSSGLRSILRQDPDIVMIGEIRDEETAIIAIQAALTGHLVLSTLHTNNASATITRLVDIGVDRFLLSSSIIGILSQRLVRVLCEECKELDEEGKDEFKSITNQKIDKLYKANGCINCNFTGYKQREAIGELFIMDDEARTLISQNSSEIEIKRLMVKNGMKTLQDNLIEFVKNGKTSLEEAIRVGLKDK